MIRDCEHILEDNGRELPIASEVTLFGPRRALLTARSKAW